MHNVALAILYIALGTGVFGFLLFDSQHRFQARPVAVGRILEAEIVKRGMRSQTYGAGGRLHSTWLLELRVTYAVAGRRYVIATSPSNRTVMASAEGRHGASPPDWMERQRATYWIGAPIAVHYRTSDPRDAVLDIDVSFARTLLLSGLAAAMIAAALVIASRWKRRGP